MEPSTVPSAELRRPCGPIPGSGAPASRRHASIDALLARRTIHPAWSHLATGSLAAGTSEGS